MDGGKIKWRLSEVNTRAVTRGQDELIGKLISLIVRPKGFNINSIFVYIYPGICFKHVV